MREIDAELRLLGKWLEGRSGIESVSILAEAAEPIALLVRRTIPAARLHLIVGNARELDALRNHPRLAEASVAAAGDFGVVEDPVDLAVLRSSGFDGKQRTRERIASARSKLKAGGSLLVLTHKKRGARDQLATLEDTFEAAAIAARGGGGYRILTGTIPAVRDSVSPREAVSSPPTEGALGRSKIDEEILGRHFSFWTHDSVFSKGRVDPGSRLLLKTLAATGEQAPAEILDLGCGYGVMGIVLARLYPDSLVTLIDIDAQAVELSRLNSVLNDTPNTRVVLSDGLQEVRSERFDLAVTHFPLHIPRRELERLLGEVREALRPGGLLYGVMLGAFDLRPLVRSVFGSVDTVRETKPPEYEYAYRILKTCRS